MLISGHITSERWLRWDIWWRWAIVSLIGITVANILYRALPDALLHPQADENIWLEQPWRIVVINSLYYTPISLAQWLVLRRYIRRARRWLVTTIGSVALLYPSGIWAFYSLGQWDAAWVIWFFGMGGITIYIAAQWLALLQWTRNVWIWALGIIVTSLGWFLILNMIALLRSNFAPSVKDGELVDLLGAIVYSSPYQLLIGGALAMILRSDMWREVAQTTHE